MNLDELGRTPIPAPPPDAPAARDDAATALKAEVDKLSSVSAGGVVDWARVVDLAAEVLSASAKDLSAAAYLGVGLAQTRGPEGLALGARILNDLCRTFWDDMTPPKSRLRGRMGALSWWQEKLVAWLRAAQDQQPLPQEAHAAWLGDLRALDASLGELLPELPPLRDLVEAFSRLPVQAAPTAPQVPSPQNPSPQASSQAAAPPQDAAAARAALAEAAAAYAALAGRENPADPWAWRASRMAAWLRVDAPPPAEDGRTLLPPPEPAIKAALLSLLAQGRNLLAAQAAEEQVAASLFWLDPHRVAAQALEALGPDYAAARDAVCAEVRLFVRRLPGVETLRFADGAPVADEQTLDWIASLDGGAAAPARRPDDAAAARDQAETLFAAQDVAGALDLLGRAARSAQDGPSRLRLTLAQMSLLCRAGHWPLAMSLAEEAVAEVERRGLEDWDPELAVEALLAAREAAVGLGGEDSLVRAGAFAARAARIRPSAALHLSG